tara:strand:+ start:484 stop:786 length:303 start_codon:yes stop_codon:yes gene_type:complete
MAIGDVVSVLGAPNTNFSFIPAVGVSIIVTSFGGDGALVQLRDIGGVNMGIVASVGTPSVTGGNATISNNVSKTMITNSSNIFMNAQVGWSNFLTGLQIQ